MSVNRNRLLFITYHYIRDPKQYPRGGIHPISPEAFAQQIEGLRQLYYVPTPEEVERFVLKGEPLPADSVFVTFDDGLADHWQAVCDVLDPLGVKAAFFVCSRPGLERRALAVHKVHWLRANTEPEVFAEEFYSYLPEEYRPTGEEKWLEAARRTYVYDSEAVGRLKFALNFVLPAEHVDTVTSKMLAVRGVDECRFCEETYMSDSQLRKVADCGHVIGVHGHSHRPFSELGDRLGVDVMRNVDYIEQATGVRPTWVSYPYGRKEAIPGQHETDALFQRFGFRIGLTLQGDWNQGGEKPSRLNRINTNEFNEVTRIAACPFSPK